MGKDLMHFSIGCSGLFTCRRDTSLFLYVMYFLSDMQITTIETPYPVKEEEENAMHNTVVIFSSNDSFTLKQVFLYVYMFFCFFCDISF